MQAGLSFVASSGLDDAASRWLRPILAAWPGKAPTVRDERVDDIVSRLSGRAGEWLAPDECVVAVIGPREPASRVDRLVESLIEHQTPGVLLMPDPSDWRLTQRHGVIFESWDADPRLLAGMIFALSQRQQAVRLLSREVLLAQRCQGGIRSEIDRLHEELHLAASIQRDYTSSPVPTIPGLDISVLFRPVNFVSGDVYSVRPAGEGKAAFLIADAVGHGVPAALLTMVLTSGLSNGDGTHAPSPAELLSRLNRRMCETCQGSGRFATAVYGVIDVATREVTVAGAGHPLPVIVSPEGSREIETAGPLLGVFDHAEFDQATFTLGPRDALLLYTDGLEAVFPGPGSSASKRRDWVARLAAWREGEVGSAGMLANLVALLDQQCGSLHQTDDVTALCIAPDAASGVGTGADRLAA